MLPCLWKDKLADVPDAGREEFEGREWLMSTFRLYDCRFPALRYLIIGTCMIALIAGEPTSRATPPEYRSFRREQRRGYHPSPEDVMRIWVVYVGQGDGILIQLPPRCSYDPDPADGDNGRTEYLDVLIDGGSYYDANRTRMADFLLELYDEMVIEHAVITHHDSDHVKGLTYILTDTDIGVESIYQNGLASYRRGQRGFDDSTRTTEAVITRRSGQLVRGMAFLESADDEQGQKLRDADLVDSRVTLVNRQENAEFQGIYDALAEAIVLKQDPIEVDSFDRCWIGSGFVNEREAELDRGVNLSGIEFRVVWPLERPRKYGDWGETINGNSLTFRLDYGDFSMLFTGDHNEKSEEKMIEYLRQTSRVDLLDVDVLKVPHHGSSHAFRAFFDRKDSQGNRIPIVSVASMGPRGFGQSWKHPNPDVVSWLGGFHRVYHTFIHEKKFKWYELDSQSAIREMHEMSHVLIETDGHWFRLVEVDVDGGNIHYPPSVQQTRRGDGTRWIRAR